MTALSVDALVLDPQRYAALRPAARAAAIAVRRDRRLPVGPVVTLEFENAETLSYQAQEMLTVEGVTDPALAEQELAAYERLLPTATTVCATLLVEIVDADLVKSELVRLAGLHQSISLHVGPDVCPAIDVPPPDDAPSDLTYSVHFLRFLLTSDAVEALRAGAEAAVVVDHPAYAHRTDLPAVLRALLLADVSA